MKLVYTSRQYVQMGKKVDTAIKVAILIYVQWTKAKTQGENVKWKLQLKDIGNAATVGKKI